MPLLEQDHPMTHRHGAHLLDPSTTRFSLWAPDAKSVALLVADKSLPMQARDDGWYSIEAPVGAGTQYRYLIDGELEVPDPASRAQAGDVQQPSVVVDPDGYRWRNPDWRGRPWHETVLYELHVGAYGGYAQIEQRLAALAELGVTAIELRLLSRCRWRNFLAIAIGATTGFCLTRPKPPTARRNSSSS